MTTSHQTGSVPINQRAIAFQRDGRVILDTRRDPDGVVEDVLRGFAELSSAAGNVHVYNVTEMALWAAAASGADAGSLLRTLHRNAAARVPRDLEARITGFFGRFGQVRLVGAPGDLWLTVDDPVLTRELARELDSRVEGQGIPVPDAERGAVKARLAHLGYPVLDTVRPVVPSEADYRLLPGVELRDYQQAAVDRYLNGAPDGGLVLLPCGAGKTVVGVAIAAALRANVLVVTPNRTVGEQWARHFAEMTDLDPAQVELFEDVSGEQPVTITTYQALTSEQGGIFPRLAGAADVPWGLVIYDEVHSLPADVFRRSAALQSRRRLGLTATLIREDGRERDVFALVGPPVWQSRWRDLERQGWISPVECFEVRVRSDRAGESGDHGLMAKIRTAERILARHGAERVLIAAERRREVHALARRLNVPAVTGETSQAERSRLYEEFRRGKTPCLVVSRVANVGVDLPDANVLIQVSGAFGSRLEEAQRLGRLLRPKQEEKPARFYTLVLPETREREFAERRQRFLNDQGYQYRVVNARG